MEQDKILNRAQLEAVESVDGPHLIIAGAGSGKTRVLVHRVAYLVEKGIPPEQILLLTFTRKASEEMLRRSSLLLDKRCQAVSGGTFHSFANLTLRKYAAVFNLPNNFTILDQTDAEDTVNLVRTKLGFHKVDKRFPRKGVITELISKSINKSDDLEVILNVEYPQFIEWLDQIKKIRDEYFLYKQANYLLDYDDLLIYLKNLLLKHNNIRDFLSNKYKYIMVDEYQDTNKLQAEIVYLLAAKHKNIMVVGDDSQSIYSFRGANFKNIIDFPKIFKGTKIITLEENYRSTQPILNLTNEVISFAEEKFEKKLFTQKKGNALPLFIETEDENSQSKYITDKILQLRESDIGLSEIAVLFRSGWHSNDLEIELASRNIPFVKYGGQKFIEAAHIKDMIAYLRIVYNIFDAVSWYRILLLIPGIGQKSAERIVQEVSLNKKGLMLDEKTIHKSECLIKLFELLQKSVKKQFTPAGLISLFLEYYQPLLQNKYDDYNKRLNDLDSLERIASRYVSLENFLTDMALEPPEKSIAGMDHQQEKEPKLILSTIHSAKGLEWHTVFLIFVAEGYLPSYLSLENRDAIEEERRLFYVAMTRAKENLFLLKPNTHYAARNYFHNIRESGVFTEVSRFLAEGNILDRLVSADNLQNSIDADLDDIDLEDIFADKD